MSTKSAYVIGLEGEVERDEKGKPKRRPDWQANATDAMGRTYNAKLHGAKDAIELDSQGFLKVKRRDGGPKPMNPGAILDDTLKLHQHEGYTYYFANAKPGRIERMQAHDWEVVQGSEGPVQLKLSDGQKIGAENTILMRKPKEWYEEDQRAKEARAIHDLTEKSSNIGAGKLASGYGDGVRADNPLR